MATGEGGVRQPGVLARAAEATVRAVARHVGDERAVLVVVLLAGVLILASGTYLFRWLAGGVMDGQTHAFDQAILDWMGRHGSDPITDAALNITALGSGLVVWIVMIVGASFLWASQHRWSAGLLLAAVAGAGIVNATLKAGFDRPRPDVFPWRVPYAGHSSFPSGHSMTAMVAYATLAYLVARIEKRHVLRVLTTVAAVLLIVAVGVSRVYLGVHYPSDVLGGFLAGLLWASFCAVAMEALRLVRLREPAIAEQEVGIETGAAAPEEPPSPGG